MSASLLSHDHSHTKPHAHGGHDHAHHHQDDPAPLRGPEPVVRGFSLLRASLGVRLGGALVLIALLWLAVFWALS